MPAFSGTFLIRKFSEHPSTVSQLKSLLCDCMCVILDRALSHTYAPCLQGGQGWMGLGGGAGGEQQDRSQPHHCAV